MAAKHRYRRPSRHPNLVAAIGGAALGIAGVGAYSVITDGTEAPAQAQSAPAPQTIHHVQQQGTVVAVTDAMLTTRDSAGTTVTYSLTPDTTSVTPQGSGTVPSTIEVGDTVRIQATVSDGAQVATAVADHNVANLGGPPMDWIGG